MSNNPFPTTFDSYQREAVKTAIYPDEHAVTYPALGLVNEAGEVAGKIKKVLRDNGGFYGSTNIDEIGSEIGDVLWYLAALCQDLGISLEKVAEDNLRKLRDRQTRGVLGGSGDQR